MKKKLVVLTGAGISAESGLRTFRDSDGLWEGHDVTEVATPRAFAKNPALVLEFYNQRRRDVKQAEPNAAHKALANLEKDFEVTIITQNIDDLHERGGSSQVLHLHGEIFKKRSSVNEQLVVPEYGDINLGDLAPDGTQWRPDIVWFEEPVYAMEQAVPIVAQADIFAVVGTSLLVYPAAGLLHYAPSHIPKYIVDRKIPYGSNLETLHRIEQPASIGVPEMAALLRKA